MNLRSALGVIETRGYTPLVTAVDGAVKAARVSLITAHLVGGGLAAATVSGEVGAVRAALDAAGAVIAGLGAEGMTHIIARPDPAVWAMLAKDGLATADEPGPETGGGPPKARPASEVPAVRPAAEAPAVKPEAQAPARRPTPEVPAVKPEAPMPALPGDVAPAPPKKRPVKNDPPAAEAPKAPPKAKKARKPGKK